MKLKHPNYVRHTLDALGIIDDNYIYNADGTLTVKDKTDKQIANAEASLDIVALDAQSALFQVQRQRAPLYPPMADYLDAVVQGDTVAVQAYKDACLAVKVKIPKP